jgi:hypothetical protein
MYELKSMFCYQQEIAEASDDGQQRYEEETPAGKRTAEGLETAVNNAISLKKQKLNAPFTKYLTIANPVNGSDFLEEVEFSTPLSYCRASQLHSSSPQWKICLIRILSYIHTNQ